MILHLTIVTWICWHVYIISTGCIYRSKIASSYDSSIFGLKGKKYHLFSVMVVLITTLLAMCKNSHIHNNTSYFFNFLAKSYLYKENVAILFQLGISCKQNKRLTLSSEYYCSKIFVESIDFLESRNGKWPQGHFIPMSSVLMTH